MWNPELAFAEGYTDGSIEVDGDLTELMESVNLALSNRHAPSIEPPSRLAKATLNSARGRVQHHYNLGNDFFALWLDDAMVYTCA
jgi:cyclopropane-fatty-acyl-phospholipid synthase